MFRVGKQIYESTQYSERLLGVVICTVLDHTPGSGYTFIRNYYILCLLAYAEKKVGKKQSETDEGDKMEI